MCCIPFLTLTIVLVAAAPTAAQDKVAVNVLIVTGDHGHDWRKTTPFLKELLQKAGHKVEVTESPGKDLTAANLARYQVVLLNYRNTPKGAKENPASVWSDDNKTAFTDAIKGAWAWSSTTTPRPRSSATRPSTRSSSR